MKPALPSLKRHWNSAFSRGVGYEPHRAGRFFADSGGRGYFIDFSPKTRSPAAANPRSLLPSGIAQLALGWWERHLAGEERAATEFMRICRLLEETAVVRDGCYLWPYHLRDRKYGTEPPWISALAQGEAASAFVRAFILHGRSKDAELALAAVRPLLNQDAPSVVAETKNGPALEESPSDPPSLILNGWIYALWGLWDVAVAVGDAAAEEMLAKTLSALRRTLPRYDVGWWTRYSLYPHRLPDLAKPFYHRLHIEQLTVLHQLTGHEEFGEYAFRWKSYDRPGFRVAAIGQKALFVASGYR